MLDKEFFTEYGEASQYDIQEVIGKGSYGIVASAIDTHSGERVAIKKINNVFEHVSDAIRILREIKLLRLLKHPDIVEIKHIMLPPCPREFKDIYVVFELMESDLHQVIKFNDDLSPGHHQFFLYQLLRALKYIHTANVFHRDLKPKNILANADCKLKICDFGLARASFSDTPTAIFWTDYVATRWYRAPELCGCFYSKYTPAVDIWSIGCIFAEMLTGKPLFPGKNVVHQLDLITDLLGTPSFESIARIRNEKARRYLTSLKKKPSVPFSKKFPDSDPLALRLLERLLAFDPEDRISAEEALADPYFHGLANVDCEPSMKHIPKLEFEFERRKLTKDDVRELVYREDNRFWSIIHRCWRSTFKGLSKYISCIQVELINSGNNSLNLRKTLVKLEEVRHYTESMPPYPGSGSVNPKRRLWSKPMSLESVPSLLFAVHHFIVLQVYEVSGVWNLL